MEIEDECVLLVRSLTRIDIDKEKDEKYRDFILWSRHIIERKNNLIKINNQAAINSKPKLNI